MPNHGPTKKSMHDDYTKTVRTSFDNKMKSILYNKSNGYVFDLFYT